MSINRNRAKLNKAQNNTDYRKLFLDELYPPYYEEGVNFYPRYRRGYKNPNKQLERFKIRMYRTWKYNRKTQWK
jgi:hypothetical protein